MECLEFYTIPKLKNQYKQLEQEGRVLNAAMRQQQEKLFPGWEITGLQRMR